THNPRLRSVFFSSLRCACVHPPVLALAPVWRRLRPGGEHPRGRRSPPVLDSRRRSRLTSATFSSVRWHEAVKSDPTDPRTARAHNTSAWTITFGHVTRTYSPATTWCRIHVRSDSTRSCRLDRCCLTRLEQEAR